ncbi:MAG: SRPBCC family protein [Solirubrobacteraceae bacterium]
MPTFDDSTTTAAPVEDVWKLLYDPSRFPEWWEGIETVEGDGGDGKGDITVYPDGYPDFPMPQQLRAAGDGRGLTISCLVTYLVFEWRLQALDAGTRISVHVEIPEEEAHRLDAQRGGVSASLRSLATLAAATDGLPAPD